MAWPTVIDSSQLQVEKMHRTKKLQSENVSSSFSPSNHLQNSDSVSKLSLEYYRKIFLLIEKFSRIICTDQIRCSSVKE